MENLSEKFLLLWKEKKTPDEENREREEEQKKIRARWKPSEMRVHTEIMILINHKKMAELEGLYDKKLAWKKAAHNKSMKGYRKHAPRYLQFRNEWIKRNPGLEFEDITTVRAMTYTNQAVPQYVYDHHPNSLLIYWAQIKVGTSSVHLKWPLQVFGVVAVRDSIDSMRNIIFNRDRDDCQILTDLDSCLTLSGPTRAVGMTGPVTIEAELKVKGEPEDSYFILGVEEISNCSSGFVNLTGARGSRLKISFERLNMCVEATVFLRVIGGTWPDGVQGRFLASTYMSPMKAILVALGDDKSIRCDGNITHLRHVVSVEDSGELIVYVEYWTEEDAYVLREKVQFKAKLSGRSFGSLNVCSCQVGVLVAWSRIRPICNDRVPAEMRKLCHY
ncbi:unnamed protein product [Urochloa decumbens]|uniref:DUF6598 domain-containing protein n=1 Tax=Urochloa decumbens TaxID=240449 RepID=A0ABC9F9C0_9POAL